MKRLICLCCYAIILSVFVGCGPKVLFPPEVELREYGTVGLIDFACNYEGNLGKYVTQRFLEEVNNAQKDARIVELGDMDAILKETGGRTLDPKTVQAIGKKYGVKAIIAGDLDISKVKPKVSISSILTSMSVRAEVEAALSAKLLDTIDSVTIWTNSARGKVEVAEVSIFSGGNAHFDASNPEDAYGDLAEALINEITRDFRATHRRARGNDN